MSLPPVCFADLFLRIFFFDDRYGDSMLLVAGEMVFQFVSGQRVSDGNLETNIRARLQFAKVRAISRQVSGHDFSRAIHTAKTHRL